MGVWRTKKRKKTVVCISVVLFAILVIGGTVSVLGKYRATNFNRGIDVASDLYFSSDKLKKSTGETDLNLLVNNEEAVNKINVFTNSGAWSSGDALIPFSIRNYDSNILYNEKNLDIEYQVEFYLLDEPLGAEYYAVNTDNTIHQLKLHEKYTLTGSVTGGSLASDTYGIRIKMTSASDYEAARVLVMAYPVSPDYVYRKADENQEYRLVGIFEGHPTDARITIESAAFSVQEVYTSSNWKTKVEDLYAFTYNIKTTGDVVLDSNSAMKQKAVVTWDHRYLNVDEYDANYQYAIAHDSTVTDEADRYITTNGNTTSMKVEVLPYASVDITFYKTADFDAELKKQPQNEQGKKWFEALVTAEMEE